MTYIDVYYGAISTQAYLTADTFTLFLHFPLVMEDKIFTLYRAEPWPAPIHNSKNFAFFTPPETEYIGVNENLNAHVLLTADDVDKCKNTEITVCSPTVAMHGESGTCSIA